MAIVEELNLEGNAEEALNAAASAADGFASSADAARDALGAVDGSSLADASAAAGDTADSLDDVGDAAGDAGAAMGDAGQDGASALDDAAEAAKGLNAALEVANKAAKVVAAVGKIAIAFGEAVSGAKLFHDQAVAALDQLTGGRGEAALDGLAAKAQGLGISTESAVEQFSALRQAGASNMDASALIALRADLDAVGVSSGEADKAVKKALDAIKHGKNAGDAIRDVAKGFGAVGDGANAAAKRSLTWAGALRNIQGLGGRVFGKIASAAGPALDAIGTKITSVLDAFEGSGAIESFGETFATALGYVPSIIDGILAAWDSFSAAVGPSIDRLGEAFGSLGDAIGDTGDGMSAASAIGSALGFAVSVVANIITGAVTAAAMFASVLSTLGGAASAAGEMVTSALGAIADFSLADAGVQLIQGFIDGILSMAGAVADAAAGVADAAAGAVKGALGIASPSKVGMGLGANFGESVGAGADEAMPEEIAMPDFAPPANDAGDVLGGAVASASVPGGSGGPSIVFEAGAIVIGGSGEGGAVTIADVEAAVRRGVESALERAA